MQGPLMVGRGSIALLVLRLQRILVVWTLEAYRYHLRSYYLRFSYHLSSPFVIPYFRSLSLLRDTQIEKCNYHVVVRFFRRKRTARSGNRA